jgi:hypothetical protein
VNGPWLSRDDASLGTTDSRRGRGKLVEESFRQIQSLDQEMTEVVLVGACHFSSQLREVGAQEIPQDDGLFSGKD